MQNLKNKLNIYYLLLIWLLLHISFAASAASQNPQEGIIEDVSDQMILSIKDSPIQLELPYLYIPENMLEYAVAKLKSSVADRNVKIDYADNISNRHMALNAIITEVKSNKSLQEILIENGLAFVYFVDAPADTKPLFRAEETARNKKAGIWRDGSYTVSNSGDITIAYKESLNHFVIIEGVVDNIYLTKKNTYLNFGKDWKTDFSAQFDNKILTTLPEFTPDKLKGRRVRVRGWLEEYNGPFMKIFNLANVEIIDRK
jgi:hypothetical protein